jgi:voltage-gated potassium channel
LISPAVTGGEALFLTGLTITFLKEFAYGIWLTSPLWLALAAVIVVLGQIAGRKEGWRPFDGFYWSFITATTIGYGDMRPVNPGSRIIAILIGLMGLTMTGILIAIAVHAAQLALAAHDAIEKVTQ